MTLDEARAHVGNGVAYRPSGEHRPWAGPPEEGTITSVSDRFVFVRYGSQRTSAATNPEDLTLLAAPGGAGEPNNNRTET